MHYRQPFFHRRTRSNGFTLVELVLVMAITSLLATIAFIGQHRLQIRARFDSSVDKIIQAAAVARSTALSNVNATGSGTDSTSVLAGTSLELHNTHVTSYNQPLTEMAPVYASQDASHEIIMSSLDETPAAGIGVCPANQHITDNDECYEQYFQTDDTIKLSDVGVNIVYLVYVNTDHGLRMCFDASGGGTSIANACASPPTSPQQFHVKDLDGLKATLEFDPVTGYVRRIN